MSLKKWLAAGTVAFVALLLVTGAALAGGKQAKTPSKPASHVGPAAATAKVLSATQVLAPVAAAAVKAASENSGESESETGTEPPGEPTPGHEDPQGVDVNHDCSPENPSGCDTANGELP
jgi:hypothetical protein